MVVIKAYKPMPGMSRGKKSKKKNLQQELHAPEASLRTRALPQRRVMAVAFTLIALFCGSARALAAAAPAARALSGVVTRSPNTLPYLTAAADHDDPPADFGDEGEGS